MTVKRAVLAVAGLFLLAELIHPGLFVGTGPYTLNVPDRTD